MTPSNHHWSGWPGAHCLKCGAGDPIEHAVANNWYDPYTREWDSPEHKKEAHTDSLCPVTGTLVWNDEASRWELHK